jgi:oligoribonuclease NrnB/cAMP/cGMP phosphodiesterase (DHH superfamily)
MIILYHANCNDGSASALAAWLKLGDQGHSYLPVIHGKPVPKEVIGQDVIIVDFCYSRQTLLNMQAKSIHILDHHISAQKDLAAPFPADSHISAHFDMTKSGAVLSWEYFLPDEPLPMLYKYIQDRDIWINQYPQSTWLSYGLSVFSPAFRDYKTLIDEPDTLAQTINGGKAVFAYLTLEADKIIANRKIQTIGGFQVPVINSPGFLASDTLHRILKMDLNAPFAASYADLLSQGIRVYSLRSMEDREDVSVIAKKLGGGGHRNAASFIVPLEDD